MSIMTCTYLHYQANFAMRLASVYFLIINRLQIEKTGAEVVGSNNPTRSTSSCCAATVLN
jgi:hypothetical protein